MVFGHAPSRLKRRTSIEQFCDPHGQQQIAIVDSKAKSLAVYVVAPDTGAIALKSVRSIGADFGLDEYNGTEPSPTKVRAIQRPQ